MKNLFHMKANLTNKYSLLSFNQSYYFRNFNNTVYNKAISIFYFSRISKKINKNKETKVDNCNNRNINSKTIEINIKEPVKVQNKKPIIVEKKIIKKVKKLTLNNHNRSNNITSSITKTNSNANTSTDTNTDSNVNTNAKINKSNLDYYLKSLRNKELQEIQNEYKEMDFNSYLQKCISTINTYNYKINKLRIRILKEILNKSLNKSFIYDYFKPSVCSDFIMYILNNNEVKTKLINESKYHINYLNNKPKEIVLVSDDNKNFLIQYHLNYGIPVFKQLEIYNTMIIKKEKEEYDKKRKFSSIEDIDDEELEKIEYLRDLVTIQEPQNWFPLARKIKRKFVYHCGPTNSGKTFNAIKALSEAKNGIYCSPLRLLSWEIHDKLSSNEIKCDLITGQECKKFANATHVSCTIEKTHFDRVFDIGVIDEIQMIGDNSRGHNWTLAVLGLAAKEIHLCGDPSAVMLIKNLINKTNDEIEIIDYKRLSDLFVEEKELKLDFLLDKKYEKSMSISPEDKENNMNAKENKNSNIKEVKNKDNNATLKEESSDSRENYMSDFISSLREGDCIVAFSKNKCEMLKHLIDRHYKNIHNYSQSFNSSESVSNNDAAWRSETFNEYSSDNTNINCEDNDMNNSINSKENTAFNDNYNNTMKTNKYTNTQSIVTHSKHTNKSTSNVTSIIYGNLPPSTKIQEAHNFNNRKTKFLIATNAIGMGLNLNINRIIFHSILRYDGKNKVKISETEVKQIAGRAGRSTKNGKVTAVNKSDHQYIKEIIDKANEENLNKEIYQNSKANQNYKAYIFFTINSILELSEEFKRLLNKHDIRFSEILKYLKHHNNFFDNNLFILNDLDKYYEFAQLISNIEGLKIRDEFVFASSPARIREITIKKYVFNLALDYARCIGYSNSNNVDISKYKFEAYRSKTKINDTDRTNEYSIDKVFVLEEFKERIRLAYKYHILHKITKHSIRAQLVDKNSFYVCKIDYLNRSSKTTSERDSKFTKELNWLYNSHYFECVYNCLEVYIFIGNYLESYFIDKDVALLLKQQIGEIMDCLIHIDIMKNEEKKNLK